MFTFSLVSTSRNHTDKKEKCKSFLEHNYTFGGGEYRRLPRSIIVEIYALVIPLHVPRFAC